MTKIKIDREKCKGCQLCIVSCPQKLIGLDQYLNKRGAKVPYFLKGKCSGCSFCALVCPECCIEIFK